MADPDRIALVVEEGAVSTATELAAENAVLKRQMRLLDIDPAAPDATDQYMTAVRRWGYTLNTLPTLSGLFERLALSDAEIQAAIAAGSETEEERRVNQVMLVAGLDPKLKWPADLLEKRSANFGVKEPMPSVLDVLDAVGKRSVNAKEAAIQRIRAEYPLIPGAPASTSDVSVTPPAPIDKLSFRTVEAVIRKIYSDQTTTRSLALDILAVYLKGQKILYTEAKTLCEVRLYVLMIPTIVVTAICTVLSLQLKEYENGAVIVSSLNAFNTFLLGLITLLKLDAKAEAHKTSAYKYDKLQSYCEFNSGRVLLFSDDKMKMTEVIDAIQTKVSEIKETNQFIVPESIRHAYKQLYGTNVFSMVKEIQNEELTNINHLKGTINELIELNNRPRTAATSKRILEVEARQNELINDIILLRDKYASIDKLFEREINEQIYRDRRRCFRCLNWLKT